MIINKELLSSNKNRYIGNCLKADPAYGKGVADALGISMKKVLK